MFVYLAGMVKGGDDLNKCIEWRKKIIFHYRNYEGMKFICPINSGERGTISEDGLTSSLSPKMILDKDYLSCVTSHVVVANLDAFGENHPFIGTVSEMAWTWQMKKPLIVICKDEYFKNHPFIKTFASDILSSVDELLEKKLLNALYKSINHAWY